MSDSAYVIRVATTWLYQYWLFAFRTAKYWGKGPRKWSFELLRFDEFPDVNSTPNTPATLGGIPEDHVMSGTEIGIGPNVRGIEYEPLLLCRWSIHCHVPCYEGVRSALPETEDIDLSNPRAWRTWQEGMIPSDMIRCLQEALSMNSFSSINAKDLPLSASYVAGAASRSPDTLKLEAFCFAIMARNEELLWELVEEVAMEDLDLTKLFPFHLAANFLDGTMGCCNILGLFATSLCKKNLLHKNYVNDLGHTVLDSLMISILKSHTSCTPQDVDIRYLQPQRFPGEEVDICGRWDADSDCVRAMNAKGSPKIPFEWKHMFCHTSAQAICHSISAIFSGDYSPDINTPSGLFLKCCGNCNTKLQLLPLHTLVLTTFYLAQRGCEGENLFGALACLMGLLVHGANPLQKAELSIDALIGFDSGELCNHSPIDPLSLAERVPKDIVSTWSGEARVGWDVFLSVLRFAQTERHLDATPIWPGNSSRAPCAHAGYGNNFYGRSPMLGTLWAAIQTELLTYRRLEESDPWLSDRFSMRGIPLSLSFDNGSMSMPLTEQNMMKPFCKCGRFPGATFLECPTTEDVCEYYFSNLEDWHRSEFLTIPRYAKELDGPGLDESDSEDYDQTWSDSEG